MNCSNCKFSVSIEYDREHIEKQIERLRNIIEEKSKQLEDQSNFYVRESYYTRIQSCYDGIADLRIKLAEMDDMIMCRRYPNAVKLGKNYWCGEFKDKTQ